MIIVPHVPYRTARGIVEPGIDVRAFDHVDALFLDADPNRVLTRAEFSLEAVKAAQRFNPAQDKILMCGDPVKSAILFYAILSAHGEVLVGAYDKQRKEYNYERIEAVD